jgi:hypothetical protein
MGRSRSNDDENGVPLGEEYSVHDRFTAQMKASQDVSAALPDSYHVMSPKTNDAFGVFCWEHEGEVSNDILEMVRAHLAENNFNDPIVALPRPDKNNRHPKWETADLATFKWDDAPAATVIAPAPKSFKAGPA